MDSFSFDATQVEPAQDVSDPIPSDWYLAVITGTTLKKTKAGTGTILEVEHTIAQGDFKGRKVWTGFNVRNPNELAEQIAKEQLSALCHATGVLRFRAPEQLHEKRCLIRVTVKRQDGYDPRNEVKAWKEAPSTAPRASTRPQAPAAQPTHAGTAPPQSESWQQPDADGLPF